jgi:predicted secreted hydrolase
MNAVAKARVTMTSRPSAATLVLLAVSIALAGCAVAESPFPERNQAPQEERPAAHLLEERDDPRPVNLPEDAAPHDRLTEWWYYTGHLEDDAGHLYGFEFVIFQVLRGDFPPAYAAHFAITDTAAEEFHYAERVDSFIPEPGDVPINLEVGGWTLTGGDGVDNIVAEMDGYALDVRLEAVKPPVLHEGDGFFEFAPGAASYYYSRTRMRAEGTLTIDGEPVNVSGNAWMDQQWGDFLVLDNVGWNWFSVQLDNGEELMAWQSHDRQGNTLDGNATLVDVDGVATDVPYEDMSITATDEWRSPATGAVYPMGWIIVLDEHDIELGIDPVMENQELITLESTGVIYWEGLVTITGMWKGEEVTGLGYVELTGYADDP